MLQRFDLLLVVFCGIDLKTVMIVEKGFLCEGAMMLLPPCPSLTFHLCIGPSLLSAHRHFCLRLAKSVALLDRGCFHWYGSYVGCQIYTASGVATIPASCDIVCHAQSPIWSGYDK